MNFYFPRLRKSRQNIWLILAAGMLYVSSIFTSVHAQNCVNPTLIDSNAVCPTLYDPVCGCDGVTYSNSCVALYHHGVTTWEQGTCPANPCEGLAPDFSWSYLNSDSLIIAFTDQSIFQGGEITSWHWDFGSGISSEKQNQTVFYNLSGIEQVCLTVSGVLPNGQICSKTVCNTVQVGKSCLDKCPLTLDLQISGTKVIARPSPDSIFIWSYLWQLDDNSSGPTDKEWIHLFNEPGKHVLCLQYSQSDFSPFCITCKAFEITKPCIDPEIIDSNAVCPTIYTPVCGCDGVTYPNAYVAQYRHGVTDWKEGPCGNTCYDPSWIDFQLPCPDAYDPVCGCDGNTYPAPCEALYNFGITSWEKGPCCAKPSCQARFRYEKNGSGTLILWDKSINAESWHLDMGDGTQYYGFFDSLVHTYDVPAVYPVCLTISNFAGTCTDTYCAYVDFRTLDVPDPGKSNSVLIFPNPTQGLVTVRLANGTAIRASLFNLMGQIIWTDNHLGNEFQVSVQDFAAGVYLLEIETESGMLVKKILKSR